MRAPPYFDEEHQGIGAGEFVTHLVGENLLNRALIGDPLVGKPSEADLAIEEGLR
jgi:hypothetical protein